MMEESWVTEIDQAGREKLALAASQTVIGQLSLYSKVHIRTNELPIFLLALIS